MIFSAYYYLPGSIQGPIIRGENFFPGKHFEMFPLWYQYLRRLYPNEDIVLINDNLSAIPIAKALPFITEPYETMVGYTVRKDLKFHVKNIVSRGGDYVNQIRNALFEAVTCAYLNNRDLLWVDNDCLLNTDIYQLLDGGDVFTINAHYDIFMMDTYFFYLSARRLHVLDEIVFLPRHLSNIMSIPDDNARMRVSQEWGFYQLFYFGETRASHNLNIAHLSCLPHLIKFLLHNPLPTAEYVRFLEQCRAFQVLSAFLPRNIGLDFPDISYEQI